jgi:hypothetical protein
MRCAYEMSDEPGCQYILWYFRDSYDIPLRSIVGTKVCAPVARS